jgi:hypothetical protein
MDGHGIRSSKQQPVQLRNWVNGCIFVGPSYTGEETTLLLSKDEKRLLLEHPNIDEPKEFGFYRVFDMSSDLLELYITSTRDVVDSVIAGVDGSIIICGQVSNKRGGRI